MNEKQNKPENSTDNIEPTESGFEDSGEYKPAGPIIGIILIIIVLIVGGVYFFNQQKSEPTNEGEVSEIEIELEEIDPEEIEREVDDVSQY